MKTRVFTPDTIHAITEALPPSATLDTDSTGMILTITGCTPTPVTLTLSTTRHLTLATDDRAISTIATSFSPPDVTNAVNTLFNTINSGEKVTA